MEIIKLILNTPEITAALGGGITTLVGLIIRRIEKKKLIKKYSSNGVDKNILH